MNLINQIEETFTKGKKLQSDDSTMLGVTYELSGFEVNEIEEAADRYKEKTYYSEAHKRLCLHLISHTPQVSIFVRSKLVNTKNIIHYELQPGNKSNATPIANITIGEDHAVRLAESILS
jgi:hypothetical protein